MLFIYIRKILYKIKSSFWIGVILVPLAIAVPTTILNARNSFAWLDKIFLNNPTLTAICSFWPLILIPAAGLCQWALKNQPIVGTDATTFLSIFDEVISHKCERFYKKIKDIRNGKSATDPADIFRSITDPEKQMEHLIYALYDYLKTVKKVDHAKFQVVLAEMGEKYVKRFVTFQPVSESPESKLEFFANNESGFSRAKATKETVIVKNTAEESRRRTKNKNYVCEDGKEAPEASMICIPVFAKNTRDVPYVISVFVNHKGYFRKDKDIKEYYEFVINQFSKRISLEHCLLQLKELSNTPVVKPH